MFDCQDAFGDAAELRASPRRPRCGTLDPAGDGPDPLRAYTPAAPRARTPSTYRATSENGDSNTVTQAVTVSATANTDPLLSQLRLPGDGGDGEPRTLDAVLLRRGAATRSATRSSPSPPTARSATPAARSSTPGRRLHRSRPVQLPGHRRPRRRVRAGHASRQRRSRASRRLPGARRRRRVRPNRSRVFDLTCTDALGDPLTYVIDSAAGQRHADRLRLVRLYTAGAETGRASVHLARAQPDAGRQRDPDPGDHDRRRRQHGADLPGQHVLHGQARAWRGRSRRRAATRRATRSASARQASPAHGTLDATPAACCATPRRPATAGPDSFTYRASDGPAASRGSPRSRSTSRTPTTRRRATAARSTTTSRRAIPINFPTRACIDADGETLTYDDRRPAVARHARRPGAGGARTYTPDPGFSGEDSFTFRASDGVLESGTGTVTITVTPPPNHPPACQTSPQAGARTRGDHRSWSCTDPDGDPVTLETVAGPAHGTLGAIDQGTDSVVYTPDPGYTGADSFTYRASDGTLTGPAATVSIDVTRRPGCDDVSRTHARSAWRCRCR